MRIKIIFGVIVVVIALVFSMQNAGMVEVKFFGWSFAASLALLIFAALVIGFVSGWILPSALRLTRRKRKEEPPAPLQ
jgi:uncharacterized integral membrane protein